jgi:putative redox protein
MPSLAHLTLQTVDGTGLRFAVDVRSGHPFLLDSGPGMVAANPVETMLATVGACEGMDVVSILRKKRLEVTGYTIDLVGHRREEHPRRFVRIEVVHRVRGRGIPERAVAEAVRLSSEQYCSVRASLREDIEVVNRWEIEEDAAPPPPGPAPTPPPAARHGLSELILRVADVPRATAFYRDVVGLAVERVDSPQWAWLWSGAPGALPRLGLTSKPLSFGAAHCGGPAHFAIAVPRSAIPAEQARLEALGVAVEGPITFQFWQADSIYFSDPDHHRVELCGFAHLDPPQRSDA